MSEAREAAALDSWRGLRDTRPLRVQLAAVMRELMRARRDQLLLERVWSALLVGTLVATAWLVLARSLALVADPWPGVAGLLAAALAIAAGVARRRRPDDLQVAIRADLELGLEQALSTAWELERRGVAPALVERVVAPALRSWRLPRRGADVFPPALTLPGRLLPLALAALLLAGLAEMPRLARPEAPVLDAVVVAEGRRLRDFGLQMQQRARREQLERSAGVALALQRLGSRMQVGALDRGEALARLREVDTDLQRQRRLAAADLSAGQRDSAAFPGGAGAPGAPGAVAASSADGGTPGAVGATGELRALLERLLAAEVGSGHAAELAEEAGRRAADTLEAAALREAIERFAEGDPSRVRELAERLARAEKALLERHALESAEARLRLARENLGERRRADEAWLARSDRALRDPEQPDTLFAAPADERRGGEPASHVVVTGAGRGAGDVDASTPGARGGGGRGERGEAVLRPPARPGEGAVHATEARALPRRNSPAQQAVAADRRFSRQLEAVISKEDVPLHEKELVRRYFLGLSATQDASR